MVEELFLHVTLVELSVDLCSRALPLDKELAMPLTRERTNPYCRSFRLIEDFVLDASSI